MSVQMLGNAVLIVLLIGWVGYKQLVWRPVVVARMWRGPAIFAVVGAVMLVQQVRPSELSALDLAIVVGELLLSLAAGAWMGAIARFRPLARPMATGKDGRDTAEYESRTGVLGLILWVAVIAVRVGVDVVATQAGSHLAASTGIILLVFAANRAARTAVFAARLDRHRAFAA
ncbi:hypothetical protein LLS1_15250 [Leifsonia sp. LS1]|uniref:hypothetical protein n=1 Tax=Leifsonia sp. LS1 TaxID=2828483 RepID=UPI001CFE146A|nr:hypothetical protein [Leifsonia sp. LS1]GIT79856.1 hypothetical protein LLS1_15250 [Leifsonia sp. LS1]